MNLPQLKIAIVGTGPAGLMTATQLSHDPRFEIHIFEKRKGFGRKLLIAGSSGLNISHHASVNDFSAHYTGWNSEVWSKLFAEYSPQDWIRFIEKELRLETFLGTSERYFVREMKASGLLKKWIAYLEARKVIFHSTAELIDFDSDGSRVMLRFKDDSKPRLFDAAAFLLGGASWLKEEGIEPAWVDMFRRKKIGMTAFEPSNVGYEVDWNESFLKEAEGKPLKKVLFTTKRGSKLGELVVTQYGLEGTPIYFYGVPGPATIDLKPDLTREQIELKCKSVRENLSPIRRVKKVLSLNDTALALLFHHLDEDAKKDLARVIAAIKAFPITLKASRTLSESISSKGGVSLSEVSDRLELKKFSRIYCGGEMLDWDAPTGGFLIQASISQGARIAKSIQDATKKVE